MPAAPAPRSVKLETLTASGKASCAEKNGVVTIKGNDAVAALQLLAKEGRVAIQLTPEEAERLAVAAKLKISVSFTRGDGQSAVKAAQTISELVAAAYTGGEKSQGPWSMKRLAAALLFIVVAVGVFLLAVAALDAVYGTNQLGRLF